MTTTPAKSLFSIILCTLCYPLAAHAGAYDLTDLGVGIAFDVNSSGEVVGQNSADHPFLWTAATGMQDLGTFGAGWGPGYARAINDQGTVVGFFYKQYGADLPPNSAFYWTPAGGLRNIGQPPGFDGSIAEGIDNQGNVTVWATSNRGDSATYRWRADSGWTFIGPGIPDAASKSGLIAVSTSLLYASDLTTTAIPGFPTHAMNNRGDLIITSTPITTVPPGSVQSLFWSQRTGTLDMRAAPNDSFFGLNNADQAVGSRSGNAAVLWTAEAGVQPLTGLLSGAPGWKSLETAEAINDAGQIVGEGVVDGEYYHHAFLLAYDPNATPDHNIPDAGPTLYPLCAGLCGLLCFGRGFIRF